jgi:hypothetical protein
MHRQTRNASLLLAACLSCAPLTSGAALLDDLAQARDVICSFLKSGPDYTPPSTRAGNDDLMVIVEGIGVDTETANVFSSRAAGARPAHVYASENRVHIVEDVNDSVIVITVLECEIWKTGGNARKCARWPAVVTWHFDRMVHKHPDQTFLALPGSSYTGHCDPWNPE